LGLNDPAHAALSGRRLSAVQAADHGLEVAAAVLFTGFEIKALLPNKALSFFAPLNL
jgi:hypothetical protein